MGQGDCTVIVPPAGQGAPILFDCADAYVAERFMADHGIDRLAAVVASHLDQDHVGGLLPFLRGFFDRGGKVGRLVMFADRALARGKNKPLRALAAHALRWERTPPHPGFVLKHNFRDGEGPMRLLEASDGQWSVDLILPFVGDVSRSLIEGGQQPNLCSAVLRVERAGTAVLIGGDAPLASWERLEPNQLSAHTIRAPHHGGKLTGYGETWQTYEDLYDSVGAQVAAVSVGTHNGNYGHPKPDHILAARRGGACRVLCTQLTPRCHADPEALRDEALLYAGGVEYPYRHRAQPGHRKARPENQVPCAGNIAVWLTADGAVHVEPVSGGDHDRLLAQIDAPLCQR
ncbi:MAG: MBL fold metallo-hydrolase [Myxococcales bacterium]|nr:MBL fold metallo-hydrolase [Myxococcales bacterium]